MDALLRTLFVLFLLLMHGPIYAMTEKQFNEFEVYGLSMGLPFEKLQRRLQANGFTKVKQYKRNNTDNYVYQKLLTRGKVTVTVVYNTNHSVSLPAKMQIKTRNFNGKAGIQAAQQEILKQLPAAQQQCSKFGKFVKCNLRARSSEAKLALNITVNNARINYGFLRKFNKKPVKPHKPPRTPPVPAPSKLGSPSDNTSTTEKNNTSESNTSTTNTSDSSGKPSGKPGETETSRENTSDSTGKPTDKNRESLKERANKGDAEAQYQMGLKSESAAARSNNNQQANKEAAEWYRKAAEQGHAQAKIKLAQLYDKGKGVGKDQQKAVALLKEAAEQGSAEAAYSLGMRYLQGRGVEQDDKQALKWFEKAANLGHKQAAYNVARMYEHGLGVKKDSNKAQQWYKNAASQGHMKSAARVGKQGGSDHSMHNYTIKVSADKLPY